MRRLLLTVTLLLPATAGCRPAGGPTPGQPVSPADDLATARAGFVTQLRVRGPAPQRYRNDAPPAGVTEVEYTSGDLKLKGWLSAGGDGTKRPVVVYLHGGRAFGAGDWEDAEPFAKAGFVLFMPMLRGENGNPGTYESFLGEVNAPLAAAARRAGKDGELVVVRGDHQAMVAPAVQHAVAWFRQSVAR